RRLPEIHASAQRLARANPARFVIPHAVIDPAHASLIDWPKPAALLPPLKAAPGEVRFAEAYLSWSEQGLALATIGQDYYDLDLLAYDGQFPLGEAYRLELDVDAGAGPRRFTLYFIPPRAKEKAQDHPLMTAKLCRGAPAEHAGNDCAAVPGGEAYYFGADQPRIAAEALLPWSALGRDGPPPDGSRSRSRPRPGTTRAGCRSPGCRPPKARPARGAGSRCGSAARAPASDPKEGAPHLGGQDAGRGDKSAACFRDCDLLNAAGASRFR